MIRYNRKYSFRDYFSKILDTLIWAIIGATILLVVVYIGAWVWSFFQPVRDDVGTIKSMDMIPGSYSYVSSGKTSTVVWNPPTYTLTLDDGNTYDIDETQYTTFKRGEYVDVKYKGVITVSVNEVSNE
ncbi:hypothetical protein N007_05475 [Alicyclobacillus acidoterrestris ATCC 49025]|nr:hypothetical protein N007_05475 [Alicyclobacillus acidoterrestris ATCC 49025]